MSHWTDKLSPFSPCPGGLAWPRGFPTAQAAWEACANPEWMCWLLGKTGTNKRDMTLLACEFARMALHHAKGDEAELAIATAEQWAHGDEEVTEEDLRSAADAAAWAADAARAAAAASYAAAADAYAADADAYAADADADASWAAAAAAYAAAAAAAAYAADADADAAYAAAYAAAANDARASTRRKCCAIIRRFYPEVPL